MPLAAVVDSKIFCIHGGLSPDIESPDDLKRVARPVDVPDTGLLCDTLWSDPDRDITGWAENDRGVSHTFGADVVRRFLEKNDLDLIVRAHQVVKDGYEFFADRGLVTVFSAPNYCSEFDNCGAMMSVDENLQCSFQARACLHTHICIYLCVCVCVCACVCACVYVTRRSLARRHRRARGTHPFPAQATDAPNACLACTLRASCFVRCSSRSTRVANGGAITGRVRRRASRRRDGSEQPDPIRVLRCTSSTTSSEFAACTCLHACARLVLPWAPSGCFVM